MVLIDGVKYACERCIRGHRVTTCTHTDQPLMMIKPKGRPSTQCAHCKEQRKLKNSHSSCTCNKKNDSKQKDHDVGCACRATGDCTCGNKNKKPASKKKDTKKRAVLPATSPSAQVPLSTPISVTTKKSPIADTPTSTSSMKFGDVDTTNPIHSWDMASPPLNMSQSESIASLNSIISDTSFSNNTPQQGRKPYQNGTNDFQYFTKRQVGMDPLQNFRSSVNTPQSQTPPPKRLGEITVPVDEYVAPLNTMNTNFTTLMSNFSEADDGASLRGSKDNFDLFSPTIDSNSKTTTILPPGSSTAPTGNNAVTISDLYSDTFPLPGNGLLDIFEDSNGGVPTKVYSNGSRTLSNGSGLSNTHDTHAPDSLFPLYPLIGPSYNQPNSHPHSQSQSQVEPQLQPHQQQQRPQQEQQYYQNAVVTAPMSTQSTGVGSNNESRLSYSNLNSHNMRSVASTSYLIQQHQQHQHQQHQQLHRNFTGSSTHSVTSLNHSHHHHHHGTHGHSHHSLYSPYPQFQNQPRRSNSFLSVSTNTPSIGSPTSSQASLVSENPEPIFAEPNDLNDNPLTNSKTNTTLMDELYQIKTYTDPEKAALSSGLIANSGTLNDELLASPPTNSNTPGSLSSSQLPTQQHQQQKQQPSKSSLSRDNSPIGDFSNVGTSTSSGLMNTLESGSLDSANNVMANNQYNFNEIDDLLDKNPTIDYIAKLLQMD